MKRFLFWVILILTAAGGLAGANGAPLQSLRTLTPVKADTPPVLDGVLDDAVWKQAETLDDTWITYNPTNGSELPQRTRAYLAYDDQNLYFAFYCHDTQPDQIKTSLTKRDGIFSDDWVGLSLDTVGTQQYGYEMFVNPSGAQGDIFRTGDSEDSSTDWVWHSAARRVADGYVVEICQPLKSIRFASGKDVRMGVVFWRRISRLNMSGSWPQLVPGKGIGGSQAPVVFADLPKPLVLEALPSFTYSSARNRLSPSSWSGADRTRDLGIGVKYGITSTVVAEATWNPDFSQVESDALQVTVNQRYPIFYSEKRPFFMEAGNFFNLAGVWGPVNMSTPVHTRLIVDPQWGARLTGELGRSSFALLAASDRSPGSPWTDGGENPDLGRQATFWIGRGKYGLGGDNFVGLLYSGREFGAEHNRTLAADLSYRLGKYHLVLANYIRSYSDPPGAGGRLQGGSLTAHYSYNRDNTFLDVMADAVDPGFRMDTAFYNRTGITSGKFYFSQGFTPDKKKTPWLLGLNANVYGGLTHDRVSGLDDRELELYFGINTVLQGSIGADLYLAREGWAGREFDRNSTQFSLTLQPFTWLNFHSCYSFGRSIYYDPADPFLGRRRQLHLQATLQPNPNLNLFAEHVICRFRRLETGERVYTQGIWRGRLTYQFSQKLFVRGLVQYDSFYQRVLSDFLASFTYVPGTVLYLGYGALNESQSWSDGAWQRGVTGDRFYQTRQSLFFKVSYRYQF